jgi:hypothetical protein
MKEVFKYQMMIVINGNARVKIFFTDGGSKIITIPAEQLAAYDAVLKQPDVFYDPVNNYFIGRDRFENRDLKPF